MHETTDMYGGEQLFPAAMRKPRIAVVEANTLASIGLKSILQEVMPMLEIDTFDSFKELTVAGVDNYVHYFVGMNIVLDNRSFFIEKQRRTIVLTMASDPSAQLSGFHCLCVSMSEKELIKSILMLEQMAHGHGQNLPPVPARPADKRLTDREIEVMALIVQGFINKEVADRLSIGLATVITHRRNIMEKLGVHSVAALTIYAVTHGYVDINSI